MDDELRLLRATAARIADAHRPSGTRHFHDSALASAAAEALRETGLDDLGSPGSGASALHAAVVAEELARALTPVDYAELCRGGVGRARGAALVAAELVGTARGALDDAVEYARVRCQFGRPVGAFQAVAHLAAEAAVDLAAAEAIAAHAAWAADALGPDEADAVAHAAALLCAEAATSVCETAVQMLGGIGMTWDHLAHVRLRRVHGRRLFLAGRPPASGSLPDLRALDTPDEAVFRAELADWIGALTDVPEDGGGWHRTLYDAGYVGVSFPTEAGGRGLPPAYEAIVNDELGFRGLPPVPPIGHLAHALRRFGDPEQRAAHLPGLLAGRVAWCQGFSEPEAGSDLAAVATRAVWEGDAYRVTGGKIWTSGAVEADRCLLLCRTGEPGGRHNGLTVLLVAMDAPGVCVEPITTAFETREFAQVFFDDARVAAADRLGAEGDGWRIAMALLGYERGPADIGWTSRLAASVAELRAHGGLDPVLADRLAHAERWLYALRLRVRARLRDRTPDGDPGPEGSVDKLLLTRVDQLVGRLRLDVLGADAMTGYLWSRAASIYGGTAQIQRDIVARRVLGLPAPG
ncbi:acyl-CoA dehydrogenase family protein [Yinghuangia seranimata]|uniref:acyl-CoA dehydrogenase family protein n=1 Tax=Yinghuangia seranimata TaxID=408067 RepID=UPI00248C4E84|nr:acyl-CoA dehydrogenase family protein [Yinghuangia seranimata]MDI2132376.1 acyl-CoA dehydrogenase family protein [Yinghuangia seranimata]